MASPLLYGLGMRGTEKRTTLNLLLNEKMAKATAAILISGMMNLVVEDSASAFIPPQDRCINVQDVIVMQPINDSVLTKEMMVTYVPTNMTPGTNGDLILRQMEMGFGQRLTDRLMQTSFFKESTAGKVAAAVDRATKQSFEYRPNHGVTQKVSVAVKAIERYVTVNYEGYLKTSLTYMPDSNSLTTVVSTPVGPATTVALTNISPMGQFIPGGMVSLVHTF